ncbi:hypothetical protein VTJ04DRAFT_5811 [Mycothermus thermophilus]|uniref:uncharacterized protein n=1 Tax=Humicola insolens TaxID=85995 RepID=UPI0037435A5A
MLLRKQRQGLSDFITNHVIGEHHPFFCFNFNCFWIQEFHSRAEWEAHLRLCEHVKYRCPIPGCTYVIKGANLLATHINKYHQTDLAGKDIHLSTLVDMCRVKTSVSLHGDLCHFCWRSFWNLPSYLDHMSEHHSSLACAALLILSGEDPGNEAVLRMLRGGDRLGSPSVGQQTEQPLAFEAPYKASSITHHQKVQPPGSSLKGPKDFFTRVPHAQLPDPVGTKTSSMQAPSRVGDWGLGLSLPPPSRDRKAAQESPHKMARRRFPGLGGSGGPSTVPGDTGTKDRRGRLDNPGDDVEEDP